MKILRTTQNHFFEPNTNKVLSLTSVMDVIEPEVVRLANEYVRVWKETGRKVHALPARIDYDSLPFGGRLKQIVAAHCSAVARSFINRFEKATKKPTEKRKKSDWAIINKESLEWSQIRLNLNLDQRVVSIEDSDKSSFDLWVVFRFPVREVGRKKFYLPIRKSKHMRDLEARGFKLKRTGLRLNRDGSVNLFYEKEVEVRTGNRSIGLDLGRNKAITCSDGHQGRGLDDLLTKIKAKKQGSLAYNRAKVELQNEVNRCVNEDIPWDDVDVLNIENLKDMKRNKSWGNKNHHWRLGLLRQRIIDRAEEHGVRVVQVNPAYTSQTCSACGHCEKGNRSGERFECRECGLEMDADINAAINIDRRGAYVSLLRNNNIRRAPALTG